MPAPEMAAASATVRARARPSCPARPGRARRRADRADGTRPGRRPGGPRWPAAALSVSPPIRCASLRFSDDIATSRSSWLARAKLRFSANMSLARAQSPRSRQTTPMLRRKTSRAWASLVSSQIATVVFRSSSASSDRPASIAASSRPFRRWASPTRSPRRLYICMASFAKSYARSSCCCCDLTASNASRACARMASVGSGAAAIARSSQRVPWSDWLCRNHAPAALTA
jgi:hypothetical protein